MGFFLFFFYENLYVMHTGHTIATQLIPVCALLKYNNRHIDTKLHTARKKASVGEEHKN